MTEEIYILRPHETSNLSKLVSDFAMGKPIDNSQCGIIQCVNPAIYFRDSFIDEIAEVGLTKYLGGTLAMEDIMSISIPFSKILTVLHKFITGITPKPDLVIIDPYFYAKTKNVDYPAEIEEIFTPFLSDLLNLKVISGVKKHDANLCAQIESNLKLRAPHLQVSHILSDDFHDRFWLSPTTGKGFLSGTSLSGLGKKYSLIDYLEDDDVCELLLTLKNDGHL